MNHYDSGIRVTKVLALLLFVGSAAAVAACGSDSRSASGAAEGSSKSAPVTAPANAVDLTGRKRVEIRVVDNEFEPSEFGVDPGAEIVFVNKGRNPHNVTPTVENAFRPIPTSKLQPGKRGSLKIDRAGVYPFYCSLHGTPTRGQNGTIVVGDVTGGRPGRP